MSIDQDIAEVMGEIFGIDPGLIQENNSPDTLPEWTSLRHIQLIVGLEKRFNIFISEQESIRLMSFKSIRMIIQKKIGS